MKNTKKSLILSVCLLSVFVLSIIGISYAYYAANITGNDATNPSISLKSGYLSIKYTDGSQSLNTGDTTITGGTTLTKTFSVTNSGTKSAYYAVWLKNVVNPFTRTKDWTYVLSVGDIIISSGEIPTQDTAIVVARGLEKGIKEDLTLKVTYAKTSEDQSVDMNKTLEFNVSVSQALSNLDKAEEGTLLNAINKNNAVVQTLTVPGKTPSGYSDTYQEGTLSETEATLTVDGTNQLAYADAYTFDSTKNVYNLTSATTGTYSDVYASLTGKYISVPAASATSSNLPKLYKVVSATDTTLTYLELSEGTNATVTEAVLASTEDDYGTSYYFRGTVNNNFVNFSGMCWRIVRIQGDGSIKITLADRDHECNSSDYTTSLTDSAFISTDAFNYKTSATTTDDLKYETSDLKTILEAWQNGGSYTVGTKTGTFEKKIDDTKLVETEWCNDMSLAKKRYYDANDSEISNASAAVLTRYYYGAHDRLMTTKIATLKCNMTGLDNTKALKIKSKIGALTADEVAFAGGIYSSGTNSNYYLKDNVNQAYWTMTPSFYNSAGAVNVWYVYLNGSMSGTGTGAKAIRPAVTLKSNVIITSGDGTQASPYVIG